jgi:hypothetical protein
MHKGNAGKPLTMIHAISGRRAAGWGVRVLAAAALGLAAAAPASAQWLGFGDGPLPPGAIVGRLMRQGFIEVDRPRFHGDVYVVDGVTARGQRVRLVIDAFDGGLVSRTRLETVPLPPRDVGPPRARSPERWEEAREFEPRTERFDPREAPPPEAEPRRAERPDQKSKGRTAKAKPPAASSRSAAKAPAEKPKADEPKATPSLPVEAAAPKAEPKPAPTAAISPTAPAKPEIVPPAPTPAPKVEAAQPAAPAASEPAAEPAGQQRSVRIIEGVAPIVPQPGEPPKITIEEPPEVTPPVTLD